MFPFICEMIFPICSAKGNMQDLVYIKPYCRISVYLIGLADGYLMHAQRGRTLRLPLVSLETDVMLMVIVTVMDDNNDDIDNDVNGNDNVDDIDNDRGKNDHIENDNSNINFILPTTVSLTD